MPWVSPTSHNDLGIWQSEANAYDGDTGTDATCGLAALGTYQGFLELLIAEISSSKLRFYLGASQGGAPTYDIDVYYSGAWHDLYEATPAVDEWVEVSYGSTQDVTKMRINYKNSSWNSAALAEVEFEDLSPAESGAQVIISS